MRTVCIKAFDHAVPPHGEQFFHHRLVRHEFGPLVEVLGTADLQSDHRGHTAI
jgi:hypothetical protein